MAWNIRASQQGVKPELEIFAFPTNDQGFASVVLDAAAVLPDATGRRVLKAGTILSKNATTNQYERFTAAGAVSAAVNEVQTVTLSGNPAGKYQLVWRGENTVDIAVNAAASTIQTALRNLDTVGASDVTVTGSAGGPYTVTFGGDLAGENVDLIDVDKAGLTNGNVAVTATTEGTGVTSAQAIQGILALTIEFVDGSSRSDQPAPMAFHGEVFRADRIIDYTTHAAALRTALPTCRFK